MRNSRFSHQKSVLKFMSACVLLQRGHELWLFTILGHRILLFMQATFTISVKFLTSSAQKKTLLALVIIISSKDIFCVLAPHRLKSRFFSRGVSELKWNSHPVPRKKRSLTLITAKKLREYNNFLHTTSRVLPFDDCADSCRWLIPSTLNKTDDGGTREFKNVQ